MDTNAANRSWWTPERVALLCVMHSEGKIMREIAGALGTTRNAVIGKVHRMGLHKTSPRYRAPFELPAPVPAPPVFSRGKRMPSMPYIPPPRQSAGEDA